MKNLLSLIALLALLTGCASTVAPTTNTVEVPVKTTCKITPPEKPSMPLTEASADEKDIFVIVKKSFAEIELRKGYELKLEAAIDECNNE